MSLNVADFGQKLPAIKGVQGSFTCFTATIEVRNLLKLISFDYEKESPEDRAQRIANPTRVNKVANYILEHPNSHVFNACTLMLRGNHTFKKLEKPTDGKPEFGILEISPEATVYPVDGQHRLKGYIRALADIEKKDKAEKAQFKPILEDCVSVCIWEETNIERSQQIFHDINYNVAKPCSSLALYYDKGKEETELTRQVMNRVEFLKRYTDVERTSISGKSKYLFTFNALHDALNKWMFLRSTLKFETKCDIAVQFFETLIEEMPLWSEAKGDNVYVTSSIRQGNIAFQAITLCALGGIGFQVLRNRRNAIPNQQWRNKLLKLDLGGTDWTLQNPDWEGMILFGGRIRKNATTIQALTLYLMNG